MLAQLVTDSTVSFCPFQPVEFANEINVNKMLLLPEGVFIVWDYDWLVPEDDNEGSVADVESQDSEVNCDTSGVTEAHSVTEIGDGGSSESDNDTVPAVTHTVTFKCIGVMREHRYQEVLRRAKDLRALGIDVPVKIAPEHDNPKDSRAVAVTCYVDGTWHRIGYLVREVLEAVHQAIEHKKIQSVKFAWIRYIAEWTRSGPGFFAGINISKSGKWPQSVMLASSTK